ncbi:DDE family transposase [Pseudoroseicyclus aestuarii]|uniref:DDE family transposase n=1 Tax=Pseudoroseicyclus aestuarii TaxID=1795041 RepID=A0A318SYR3_9RHOB|nr:DDE family transposase [Pseudoroseicyclus aestuarii]
MDAAVQACLTIKVLFGLVDVDAPSVRARYTAGFVASLLKLAGLEWPVPDASTLCRCQKRLDVQLPNRNSGGPLHLLVDSTGIKGERHARHAPCQLTSNREGELRPPSDLRDKAVRSLTRRTFA